MKQIILNTISKKREEIISDLNRRLIQTTNKKLSGEQIQEFSEKSLKIFEDILKDPESKNLNDFLFYAYKLFLQSDLTLLEISRLFNSGRSAIIHAFGNEKNIDTFNLIEEIDKSIEFIYGKYGMLHQQIKTTELTRSINLLSQKLEENQQYLENILQTSDSAIMVIDRNEKIIAWNKGAEEIFGYSKEEIINQPSSFLFPPGKKYKDELEFIKREVYQKGSVQILETERDTKAGKTIPVELSVTRLNDNEGNYYGRTVVIKDVTEVKRLQQQVDQSEKLAVIGQLAAGVAHEIGNPLASISSLVQILQRKLNDKFLNGQLSLIKNNIDRISKIVRELVDLSRPPSNKVELTQVTDIIKTALGIVRYDKRVKEVKFETKLDEKSPFIKIVPDQLLQVFINILINALDAIEGSGKITIISSHDDDYIYIDFIDNGCGIEKSAIKNIFDPFYTTKEAGKGTGLGLAISFNIITKMNGKILVSSTPGKGSKFSVVLPVNGKKRIITG